MEEVQVGWKKDQVAWKSTIYTKSQFSPVKWGGAESRGSYSGSANSCPLRATRNEDRFTPHAKEQHALLVY